MRDGTVLNMLLDLAVKLCESPSNALQKPTTSSKCEDFLCLGDESCRSMDCSSPICTSQHYYDLVASLTYILLGIGNNIDLSQILLTAIDSTTNWAQCFDRRQVL
ncbi:hypothetical protein ILUMI_17237 [Ignelater luminosus]|uniref:Uncharacterized protein n=1 Tax=Ignelater luminosus TaxID=2038154 RepID=A0A8K0CNP7_IGNLU|nr:hypothetical protein ILUMI_17237 [Ignelater luminosus]